MKKVYDVLLGTLLQTFPRELSEDASRLREDCKSVRVTPQELLAVVKKMTNGLRGERIWSCASSSF